MRFTRTEAEIDRIEAAIREPRFLDATVLTAAVRTDREAVAELLPPGIEPAEPRATVELVSVGRSNCVGPFDGGGLYVRARRGDRTGQYCLSMPTSTDAAVRWGRVTPGEPKKLASIRLDREGDHVRGTVERHDTRLLDLDATLTDERDPAPGATTVFHYKFQPAVDGDGVRADPALVAATIESDPTRVEQGDADLGLDATPTTRSVTSPSRRYSGRATSRPT